MLFVEVKIIIIIGSSSDVSIYGDGWQPLHYACYKGHYEIVNELLDINVNVNCTNDLGFTPLFYAAQMGFIDICKILLEKGADPAVSGGVADSNVFMCPVDHAIDYPELQKIFKIHPRCKPPQQPPITGAYFLFFCLIYSKTKVLNNPYQK